jgi:hypothetical protein
MAGSTALHDAHIEVGPHGLALFLSVDSPLPALDIDAPREELRDLVRRLSAALGDVDIAAATTARDGAWDLSS